MGRSAEAWQEQQDAQQQYDELSFHLWASLEALRGHISAETFQAAERELGFLARPT